MRYLLLLLLLAHTHVAFSKVCTVKDIGIPSGFKFHKPDAVLKFQTVEYEARFNANFSLIRVGEEPGQEVFLLIREDAPDHYSRFMTLKQNTVKVQSWNSTSDNCPECTTAARLLLYKKGKPQKPVVFEELKLPFCNQIDSSDLKFPICSLVPLSKETQWQQSQGIKYSRGPYTIDFQIPGSSFSYLCSTIDWHENLKLKIPSNYRCDPVTGPSLVPSAKIDRTLPKHFFQIDSQSQHALLREGDFESPPFGEVIDQARFANVYDEFCQRHHNCLKGWDPKPLPVGLKASFGFQAVCLDVTRPSAPVDFCETKEDCVWAPNCCSEFPANKNFKRAPQLCPDVVCSKDSAPPLKLECRNFKCVGVAQ